MKVSVEISKNYLLTIATHGNMGSGELPDLMQHWAIKVLIDNGLGKELEEEQNKKLKQLFSNIKKVAGDDFAEQLLNAVSLGQQTLNIVKAERKDKAN